MKMCLDTGTSRTDRDRIFQAYSALVLATLFYVFNPPLLDAIAQTDQVKVAKVQLQAGGYFFAFIAFAIALRFLFAKKKEDIRKAEYDMASKSLYGFMGMFLGITVVYLGVLYPVVAAPLSALGSTLMLISALAAALMIGAYVLVVANGVVKKNV